MKKIFLATLSILTTTLSFGQTVFGLKAGMNLSTTQGFALENKSIIAEHGGVYANINFSKRLFLRPELLYTVKGYKFPAIGMHDKGTLSFSYIAVPMLIGYRPTNRFSVSLGPEAGYLINAKYRFPDSTASHPEYFNKVDLAINIGTACTINRKFSAELRYSHGFKGLVDVTYTDQYGNQTGKGKIGAHRNFQLSLNYQLTNK